MSEEQSENNALGKRSKGARGLHRLPLTKAIDIAKSAYELGQGYPVSRALTLDHLKRSPTAGSSSALVGASNTYGLTKLAGDQLELTELGRIFGSPDSSQRTRTVAAHEALFASDIFSAFIEAYKGRVIPPNEAVLVEYFKRSHGLSDSDARAFWQATKENLVDFGLIKETDSGRLIVLSRDDASKLLPPEATETTVTPAADTTATDSHQPPTMEQEVPIASIPTPTGSSAIAPEFHFNIQIHLPGDAAPDQYDAIFRSIATHLLGRQNE